MAGRKLDDLIIGLQLTTKALEQGMNDVKKKLNSHTAQTKQAAKGYDELAIVAGYAFTKIVGAVNSGVKAFNDYRNSMVGLQSIAKGTGNSFTEAQGFIESFTNDGLVPASNAATALKNLLSRGFSMSEAADVLSRFKDAAAFGRQGALSLGEAIQSASEGIKNENSILVDNAGVTKNVSVMWKEYAATIGKTADTLTIAEKRQAEYTGIMQETKNQVGDAAKYAKEFSGAQAKAAAETLKLQQAVGGSMVPALSTLYSIFTPLISLTTELINKNPILAGSIIAATTTLAALATGTMAVVSAFKILKPAITAVTAVMATNPVILGITIGLVALVGIITAITAAVQKAKKAQEEYNNSMKEHDRIVKEGITKTEIPALQEKVDKLKELSRQYDEINTKLKALQSNQGTMDTILSYTVPFYGISTGGTQAEIDKYIAQLKKIKEELKSMGASQETVNGIIKDFEKVIRDANIKTGEQLNNQAREIAQRYAAAAATQNLINIYKTAQKSSSEWREAEKKLAEQFPQFSTAAGIKIDAIDKVNKAQSDAIDAEWSMLQAEVTMTKIKVAAMLAEKTAALGAAEAEKAALMGPGDARHFSRSGASEAWKQKKAEADAYATSVAELRKSLAYLEALAGTSPEDIPGIEPLELSGIGTYQNAALDSALKIMEHKKRMNQLSVEDEIKTLESILKKYARTADEKMDIEERLFDAKQALRDREQKAIEDAIESEAEKLSRRTDNSMRWIEDQKLYDTSFGVEQEIAAYNRVIKYHKEYLNKIMADTKISKEEKEKIYNEETRFIADQQRKIYEIQKSAVEKAVNDYISAKQKQYDTEERLENERLNKKLADLDKEYRDKENAVKVADREKELASLYEQEKRFQNAATKEGQEKLKDIRDRISDLTRDAEQDRLDAEKETRREAIEEEIKENQSKYKTLREDLLTSQKEMLAAATSFANEANKELTKGANDISTSLQNVIKQFDTDSTSLVRKGIEKLRGLVSEYKKLMDSISLKPTTVLTPSMQIAGANGRMTGFGSNVTINDYGNKILSGIEDIQDYGKELVIGANNATRG